MRWESRSLFALAVALLFMVDIEIEDEGD